MNILILGGTHLVGPFLINLLLKQNHTITIFNRGQTKIDLPPEINQIYGDRRRLQDYKKPLQACKPDVVIDMIAMTQSDAEQLIDIFQVKVERLVVISSGDVYLAYEKLCMQGANNFESLPLSETSALRQQLFPYRKYAKNEEDVYYTYDKILVEKIIAHSPMNSTVLRFPFVYGPQDTLRVLPYLKNMVDKHSKILLDSNKAKWRCTRGYAEDLATAVVAAALDERKGQFVYNVGEKIALSEKEWIQRIANILNWPGTIDEKEKNELPVDLQESLNWQQSIVYDTKKIRQDLNYQEIYSSEQALKNTINWTLKNMHSN